MTELSSSVGRLRPYGPRAAALGLAVVAMVGAAFVLLRPGDADSRTPAEPAEVGGLPLIQVERPARSLGKVPLGEHERVVTFPIRNGGTGPLVISDMNVSCTCTKAGIDRSRIEPDQAGTIRMALTVGKAPGKQGADLRFTTNDPAQPRVRLLVEWETVPNVTVSTESLHWADLHRDAAAQRLQVTAQSADLLAKLEPQIAATAADAFSIREVAEPSGGREGETVAAANRRTFVVAPTPDATQAHGRHGAKLLFYGSAPNARDRTVEAVVDLVWQIPEVAEAYPASLVFGDVVPHEAKSLDVIVKNRQPGDGPFEVTESPEAVDCRRIGSGEGLQKYRLTYRSETGGAGSGTVVLRQPGSAFELRVPVSWYPAAAAE